MPGQRPQSLQLESKKHRTNSLRRKTMLNNMTSALGTTSATRAFMDASKPQKLTVRLPQSLTDQEQPKKRLKSVSFNHKPSQTQSKRTCKISKATGEGKRYELKIRDTLENGNVTECKYAGWQDKQESAYALVFDGAGACSLEPLGASYSFNMTSAPWESNSMQLGKDYVQLPLSQQANGAASPAQSTASAEDVPFREEPKSTDGPPDSSNPFDWRHYINRTIPTQRFDSKPPSAMPTPKALSPMKKPHTPNQSAATLTKKANQESAKPGSSSQVLDKRKQVESPKERPSDATPRQDDDDETWTETRDYGELIIEDDTPSLQPPKRHHLLTTPRGGPISLREASAAASGTSTPLPTKSKGIQRSNGQPRRLAEDPLEESEGEDASENDDDVDELELPPPAVEKAERDRARRPKRPKQPRRESTWDANDVAEFQARLAQLQDREDEEDVGKDEQVQTPQHTAAKPPESDSESEEE